MENILHTYRLNFFVKETNDKQYGLCETSDPAYRALANFITCIPWADSAADVISGLSDVLNQQTATEAFESQTITVESGLTHSVFADDTNAHGFSAPDLIIPTADFYDIMLEWKNFLLGIR